MMVNIMEIGLLLIQKQGKSRKNGMDTNQTIHHDLNTTSVLMIMTKKNTLKIEELLSVSKLDESLLEPYVW